MLLQGQGTSQNGSARVRTIPRSREVGQSYLTSVWTTLVALWMAFVVVYQEQPRLVRASTRQRVKHASVPAPTRVSGPGLMRKYLYCRSWSTARAPAYPSARLHTCSGAAPYAHCADLPKLIIC